MIGVDLVVLAIGGAVVVALAALVGGRVARRADARRRRLQGARNTEEEKQRLDERCAICDAPIDPADDLWDRGRWWHRACYRKAVH